MKYTLNYSGNSLTADTFGAELLSVITGGKERLYQGGVGKWAGHAPILFPVCGKCSMKADGKVYPMPFHGFAKRSEFTLKEKTENSIAFSLASDGKTLAVYPFDFLFTVKYVLENDGVTVIYSVKNTGDKVMYFSLGGHESFALDMSVDNYELDFGEKQTALRYSFDGFLSENPVEEYENLYTFHLPEKYLSDGSTVIFNNVKTDKVILKTIDGEKVAEASVAPFENLLLWQPDGEKCICIEPWLTLPDSKTSENFEFNEKKGVIKLAKGEERSFVRNIKYY